MSSEEQRGEKRIFMKDIRWALARDLKTSNMGAKMVMEREPLEFFLFIKFVISISIRDSKSNMKTSRIEMQIIRKRKISSGTHAKTDTKRIRDLQMILTSKSIRPCA